MSTESDSNKKRAWERPERNLSLEGTATRICGLDFPLHAQDLFRAASLEANNGEDIFTYMLGTGPFYAFEPFSEYLKRRFEATDSITYVVFSKRLNRIVGSFCFEDIVEKHGSIEIGAVWYAREVQRSEINTEVMFLAFTYVFETLRYRRLVWRCNNANEKSRNAAIRLGFQFEGVFRQHNFDKGKNRDTAWFSILDSEWEVVKRNFVENLLNNTRLEQGSH